MPVCNEVELYDDLQDYLKQLHTGFDALNFDAYNKVVFNQLSTALMTDEYLVIHWVKSWSSNSYKTLDHQDLVGHLFKVGRKQVRVKIAFTITELKFGKVLYGYDIIITVPSNRDFNHQNYCSTDMDCVDRETKHLIKVVRHCIGHLYDEAVDKI